LKGPNFRPAEFDGELQVHVRVFDLNHLEQELALKVDVHRRPQEHAVIDDLAGNRIQ
jgi:hypothetical protein